MHNFEPERAVNREATEGNRIDKSNRSVIARTQYFKVTKVIFFDYCVKYIDRKQVKLKSKIKTSSDLIAFMNQIINDIHPIYDFSYNILRKTVCGVEIEGLITSIE